MWKEIKPHLQELSCWVVVGKWVIVPAHSMTFTYTNFNLVYFVTHADTLTVPKYHRCFVETISSVTHDSKMFSLRLPAGSYLNVPTGHHLAVRAVVDGKQDCYAQLYCSSCSAAGSGSDSGGGGGTLVSEVCRV